MVAAMNQRDGGLMPILRLPAHIAHGLVQQDGHLRLLVAGGARVNFHAVRRAHLHAHRCGLAVDQDPALFNPSIGFAA